MAIASLIAQILGNNASKKRSTDNFNNQNKLLLEQDRMEQEKEKRARGYKKEDVGLEKASKDEDSSRAIKQAQATARIQYLQSQGIDPSIAQNLEAISDAAEQNTLAQLALKKQEAETGRETSRQTDVKQRNTFDDVLKKVTTDASMAAGDSEFQKNALNDPSFQDARTASFQASYLKPVFDLAKSATVSVSPGESVRRPSMATPVLDRIVPPMTGTGMTQGETTKILNIGGMPFPQTQRTVTPGSIAFGSEEFNVNELPGYGVRLPAGAQNAPTPAITPRSAEPVGPPANLFTQPRPVVQQTDEDMQSISPEVAKLLSTPGMGIEQKQRIIQELFNKRIEETNPETMTGSLFRGIQNVTGDIFAPNANREYQKKNAEYLRRKKLLSPNY